MDKKYLDFYVSNSIYEEFKKEVSEVILQLNDGDGLDISIKEPKVFGQDMSETLNTIIIALGGGVGVAAIIKALGDAIEKVIKANRGEVEIKKGETSISLNGYTSKEVQDIIEEIVTKDIKS